MIIFMNVWNSSGLMMDDPVGSVTVLWNTIMLEVTKTVVLYPVMSTVLGKRYTDTTSALSVATKSNKY